MKTAERAGAPKVSFTRMADGTKDDYELLHDGPEIWSDDLATRLLKGLEAAGDVESPYQISRLGHSLQTATRALRDDAERRRREVSASAAELNAHSKGLRGELEAFRRRGVEIDASLAGKGRTRTCSLQPSASAPLMAGSALAALSTRAPARSKQAEEAASRERQRNAEKLRRKEERLREKEEECRRSAEQLAEANRRLEVAAAAEARAAATARQQQQQQQRQMQKLEARFQQLSASLQARLGERDEECGRTAEEVTQLRAIGW